MMDVTGKALVLAGSSSQADGLFITTGLNCPLWTLKCHRAVLNITHLMLMDVAGATLLGLQVTLLLAV